MEKELSKLLGAQFDLDIDTNDVYEFLIKKNVRFFLILGTFMVGVHKMNVSPQNHSQDTTLYDHYVYKIIYLVKFPFYWIITYFLIKMVAIFCDVDD